MKKFLLFVPLILFFTGCAPYMGVYKKVDKSDKSITISGDNEFAKKIRKEFLDRGWKVYRFDNSSNKARYELFYWYRTIPSITEEDRYMVDMALFDNKADTSIRNYRSLGGMSGAKTVKEIIKAFDEHNIDRLPYYTIVVL